ncbi:hypothetical protein KIPB_001095, partial [Kipferlia bialata]|eukprot:g1095.t1
MNVIRRLYNFRGPHYNPGNLPAWCQFRDKGSNAEWQTRTRISRGNTPFQMSQGSQ